MSCAAARVSCLHEDSVERCSAGGAQGHVTPGWHRQEGAASRQRLRDRSEDRPLRLLGQAVDDAAGA